MSCDDSYSFAVRMNATSVTILIAPRYEIGVMLVVPQTPLERTMQSTGDLVISPNAQLLASICEYSSGTQFEPWPCDVVIWHIGTQTVIHALSLLPLRLSTNWLTFTEDSTALLVQNCVSDRMALMPNERRFWSVTCTPGIEQEPYIPALENEFKTLPKGHDHGVRWIAVDDFSTLARVEDFQPVEIGRGPEKIIYVWDMTHTNDPVFLLKLSCSCYHKKFTLHKSWAAIYGEAYSVYSFGLESNKESTIHLLDLRSGMYRDLKYKRLGYDTIRHSQFSTDGSAENG